MYYFATFTNINRKMVPIRVKLKMQSFKYEEEFNLSISIHKYKTENALSSSAKNYIL